VNAFCVRCGKEGETYGGLCAECYLDSITPISLHDHVDLERCTNCEEYLVRNRWVRHSTVAEAVEDAAIASLMVMKGAEVLSIEASSRELDPRNYLVHLDVLVEVSGLQKRGEGETIVRLKNTVCHRCSRLLGNYYEAILQVRGTDRSLPPEDRDRVLVDIADRVEAASRTNRQLFISRVEEMHGGVDVYLSSTPLGRALQKELASAYGAETKESSTLVGRKAGDDVYRMTFLIRLPPYKVSDIVLYEGNLYQLASLSGGAKLISLLTHETTSVKQGELKNLKVVGNVSDAREAVVVTATEEELEILDPLDYSTVPVRRPKGYIAGETVRVFIHEEEPFLLP